LPRPLVGREPTIPVTFRIEPSVWEELRRVAKQDDKGVAEVARIAIYQYLKSNPVNVPTDLVISEQEWWDHRVAVHNRGVPTDTSCTVCEAYFAQLRST